jgi:hypothetical protein
MGAREHRVAREKCQCSLGFDPAGDSIYDKSHDR